MARAASTFDDDVEPVRRREGDFKRHPTTDAPYVSDPTGALVKPKRKSDPPRIKTVQYGRPSSYGKIIENTYNLQKWSERRIVAGVGADPELAALCAQIATLDPESKEFREAADKAVKRAKIAAKAGLAAERGTHGHALTEDDDNERDWVARAEAGEDLGIPHDVQATLVQGWRTMLADHGLEILAVEAAMVHDRYRVAGTLDRIARLTRDLRFVNPATGEIVDLPAGVVIILDVKTGKLRFERDGTIKFWQTYAVQTYLYASGSPYDVTTDTRGEWPWPIDQRWALIAHLDILGALEGSPSCRLVLVDLEAGRAATELCAQAIAWEKRADVFAVMPTPTEPRVVVELAATIQQLIDAGDCDAALLEQVIRKLTFPAPAPTPADGQEAGGANEATAPPAVDPPPTAPPANSDVAPPCDTPVVAGEAPTREGGDGTIPASQSAQAVSDSTQVDAVSTSPATLTPAEQIAQMGVNPDEGGPADETAFEALQDIYKALPADVAEWIARLAHESIQAHVSFHAKGNRTIRRFEILRGLVALAGNNCADDVTLRALLGCTIGDRAHHPAVTPGHALGSLNAVEAAQFACHATGDEISQPTAA